MPLGSLQSPLKLTENTKHFHSLPKSDTCSMELFPHGDAVGTTTFSPSHVHILTPGTSFADETKDPVMGEYVDYPSRRADITRVLK